VRQITILSVGGDFSVTDNITTNLNEDGYPTTVKNVTSSIDVLNRLIEDNIDCIVSAYKLPETTGIKLLQQVRKNYPDLPFVLYTNAGDATVASDAIAANVTAYLPQETGHKRHNRLGNRISQLIAGSYSDSTSEIRYSPEQKKSTADVGIIEVNVDSGEIWLSAPAGELLGISDGIKSGIEPFVELVHSDDVGELSDTFDDFGNLSTVTTKTWRWLHPNRGGQTMRFSFFPATSSREEHRVRGVVQKWTNRENDRDEHQRFQQAIDEAKISITLADPSKKDTPLVYVNQAFVETTGYTTAEALGRNCRFLQGKETDPKKVAEMRSAIKKENSVSVELRNYRKDGSQFWNRVTLTPIYDDNNQLVRYLGTQENITRVKQQEQQLTAERHLITRAINTLDDLFYVLDIDGKLQRWNDRVPAVTGYTEAELDGKDATEFFPQKERQTVGTEVRRMLSGETTMFEANLLTADGKRVPFEFDGARLVDDHGETMGVVGIAREVIERNERRQHLDLLARVLRHNLRNRINVIHGRADIIQTETTNEISESASAIMNASEQLLDITEKERQLVELLRQPPENQYIEVSGVFDRVLSQTKSEYPEVEITVSCPDDMSVYGGEQFYRAIEELVENAALHNDSDSPLIDISVSKSPQGVQIEITDNCPYIPDVERDVLLKDDAQTPLYHGSGLGLSLVRLLTLRSGGSISYEKNSPTGNKISLRLPGKNQFSI